MHTNGMFKILSTSVYKGPCMSADAYMLYIYLNEGKTENMCLTLRQNGYDRLNVLYATMFSMFGSESQA